MSSIARNYLNQLNADYLQVHRRKEDLFWSTYMGTSDDQAGFTAAEQAFKAFCADPARACRCCGRCMPRPKRRISTGAAWGLDRLLRGATSSKIGASAPDGRALAAEADLVRPSQG